jgi:hypothetical protein
LAWSLRTRWAAHSTYLLYSRVRHPLNVIDRSTELVIEAFPRSANTFATVAFQISQPEPVRVAHHLHAPAQIIAAVRRDIPALVPVRHPRDAAISQAIRSPGVSLERTLAAYEHFHTKLLPYRTGILVAKFEDVTRDFGSVTQAVNQQFGTRFSLFSHDPERVEQVYRMIDDRARAPHLAAAVTAYRSGRITRQEFEARTKPDVGDLNKTDVPAHLVARPIEGRRDLKAALQTAYESPRLHRTRTAAEAAYRRIIT